MYAHLDNESYLLFSHEIKELPTDYFEVVIVGAGLAGLSTAVEAAKGGKRVLLIESREEDELTLRPQLIHINSDTTKYLESMCAGNFSEEDKKLLYTHARHIAIKDIQKFLKRHIDPNMCTVMFKSTVSEIKMEEGYVVLSNVEDPAERKKIFFKDLSIAEGSKRTITKLLKPYVEYHLVQDRPEKYHTAAYMTVQRKDEKPMPAPEWDLAAIAHEDRVGVIYTENPIGENPTNKNPAGVIPKLKTSFVMHITEEMAKRFSEDREAGIQYVKECVASVFDKENYNVFISKSKKENVGAEKDKLKFGVFKLNFTEANIAAFSIQGHRLFLEGDAYRDPDFYAGLGGNHAIEMGRTAGDVINGVKTLEEYNETCKTLSDRVASITLEQQPTREVLEGWVVGTVDSSSFEQSDSLVDSKKNSADEDKTSRSFASERPVLMEEPTKLHSGNLRLFSMDRNDMVPDNNTHANNVKLTTDDAKRKKSNS